MLDSLKVGQRIKFSPKGDVYATKKDGPKHVKLKDPPKEFVGEIVGIFDLPKSSTSQVGQALGEIFK